MASNPTRGRSKIDWATSRMPLLNELRTRFLKEQPFADLRIAMSIHLEAKTACLAMLLRDGGACVSVTGSNPLSTQDDIASALAEETNVSVYARHGVSPEEYDAHLEQTVADEPHLVLDDGGDLVSLLHKSPQPQVLGGCEETTTGVHRLRLLAEEGKLIFPMFAVNDARMKSLFDNRYGTGQSVWDGIFRSTNLLIAGKNVLVVGYGWCGRGIALRAQGLGARVTVADVDPVHALEAWMEGFDVAPVAEAVTRADLVITATGCADAVPEAALSQAKDGIVLCNAGHFNVEVRPDALERLSSSHRAIREGVEEYVLPDGRKLYLLGEGRLVNLALGDGHPVEIMDLSFAVQALTLEHMIASSPLEPNLYPVPPAIDEKIARMKLDTLGVRIDSLTDAQREYLGHSPSA